MRCPVTEETPSNKRTDRVGSPTPQRISSNFPAKTFLASFCATRWLIRVLDGRMSRLLDLFCDRHREDIKLRSFGGLYLHSHSALFGLPAIVLYCLR